MNHVNIAGDQLYPDHGGDWSFELGLDLGLQAVQIDRMRAGAAPADNALIVDLAALVRARLGEEPAFLAAAAE